MVMYFVGTDTTEVAIRAESEGPAMEGISQQDTGVLGFHGDPRLSETTVGSFALRAGVFGASEDGAGVLGYARSDDAPAVLAFGGLLALAVSHEFAGEFRGNVKVTGDILLSGADCAEQFDVLDSDDVLPGSVLVIDDSGGLRLSQVAYDTRVAGIVSGAGNYRPGVVLDQQPSTAGRRSVALIGKANCLVDSSHGAIAVGDLLTTSPTAGHAMRASDSQRAFGSVLGKALQPWDGGRGLIAALVMLG
jgi:hypothetical protein